MLDLKGNVVHLSTLRNPRKYDIIDEILKHGHPSIFATDVSRVPSSVRAIASSFGCRVVHPEKDMPVEEKEELIRELPVKPTTLHERDALASAVFAFKKFRGMFEKAEKISDVSPEFIKDLVLRGEASNIAEARKMLMPEEEAGKLVVKVPVSTRLVLKLRRNLERAEAEIKALREKLSLMERQIQRLRRENEILRKARKKVVMKIDVPKTADSYDMHGLEEILQLEDFTRKSLYDSNITGRVVFIRKPEGSVKLLKRMKPKLVIADVELPLPSIKPSEARIIRIGDRMFMEEQELERILNSPEMVARRLKHE